jgi:hypothetical protein
VSAGPAVLMERSGSGSPSDVEMAVLPPETAPPTWVTVVDIDKPDIDGSRAGYWKSAPVGSEFGPFVSQWVKYTGDEVRLSEPWIDMGAELFELTPREASALSRELVKAAKLLERATAETWELLGAAGNA